MRLSRWCKERASRSHTERHTASPAAMRDHERDTCAHSLEPKRRYEAVIHGKRTSEAAATSLARRCPWLKIRSSNASSLKTRCRAARRRSAAPGAALARVRAMTWSCDEQRGSCDATSRQQRKREQRAGGHWTAGGSRIGRDSFQRGRSREQTKVTQQARKACPPPPLGSGCEAAAHDHVASCRPASLRRHCLHRSLHMSTRKPCGVAARALADSRTLLSVTLQTPPEEQVVALTCLASLSRAVRLASMPVWRKLCLGRWPSSNSLEDLTKITPPAWRAFALARSAAESEEAPGATQRTRAGAARWKDDLKPFFARKKPLLLLDVFVEQETAIFSAQLSANRLDSLLRFAAACVDGIIADDEEAAEEFADAHQYLHLTADTLPSFPQRLLMLLSRGMNQLEVGVCMLQDDDDLELWNTEGQAPWMTAQLCLMLAPDKIAVLHLGAPTCDSDVSGCDLEVLGEPAQPWQELPFGMLRWARTFVAGDPGHRSGQGFDVILNLYCLGTSAEDYGEAVDVANAHEHAAPVAMQNSSPKSPESDVSGGEAVVHEVAEARQRRLQRLVDALRTLDAERAVLQRQLNECALASGGAGGHDSDLDDVAAAEDSDPDLAPSPRRSDSSQRTRTTASSTSSDSGG